MAEYLRQVEFAQLCGITRQAVSKAKKAGRLELTNGRIDPEHPTNKYFREQYRPGTQGQQEEPAAPGGPRRKVGPKDHGGAASEPEPTNGFTDHVVKQLGLDEIDKSTSGAKYKNQVDLAKVLEQIKGLQLKNDEARNKLISRDLVQQVLTELKTVETAEFLSMGEKLAPEIASLFGVDDQTAILDAGKLIQIEVSQSLEHIEMTIDKFLKSFQVEGT